MPENPFQVSSVHDVGITVLFEPKKPVEPIVDIVFIHGLQGHPRNTWTWESKSSPPKNSTPIERDPKKKGLKLWSRRPKKRDDSPKPVNHEKRHVVFWPYHLLHGECPSSRILTWGYNSFVSTFFLGSANKNDMFSYSRDLLGDLNRIRAECQNRPLIIVAHSLGGIIAKQIFLDANDSTQAWDQNLSNSIKGIFFLGTPHQGSPMVDLGETIRSIASAAGFDTSKQNIRILEIDSPTLKECQRRLHSMLKHHNEVFICIFQEGRGLSGLSYFGFNQKVVPNFSSSIEGVESVFTIDTNHMDMCRYSDKTSDGYRKVAGELQRLCESVRKAEEIRSEEEKMAEKAKIVNSEKIDEACLDSLAYREMNYRQLDVLNTQFDPSDWIFRHDSCTKWLSKGSGLLWIKGKPGSGKSTLMKKIFKSIDEHKPGQCVQIAFFFHRRGNSLQQTPVGMFRTMLHQLLSQVPVVGAEFRGLWEQKKKWAPSSNLDWEWRIEELREVFSSALLAAAKSHTIIILVDALDEAGNVSAQEIVPFFHKLNEKLSEFKAATSICFSCRHFPIFAVKNAAEIWVENENHGDIVKYIHAELGMSLSTDDLDTSSTKVVYDLQQWIAERASGVFLWVALMIPIVIEQHNAGESLNTIQKRLATAPADLDDLYKDILIKSRNAENHARALRLFQWIVFAERPLSVTELRFAMASDDTSVSPSQNRCQESKDFIDSDERMKKQITSLSGGLAEVKYHDQQTRVRDTVVQFIHQSVNDF